MYRRIGFVWIIAVAITLTGCTNLSKFDLSGQLELERKDDGLPYREIYQKYYYDSHPITSNLLSILIKDNCIDMSDIFSQLNFTKKFSVAQNNYNAIVKFKEIPPQPPSDYIRILDSNWKEVPISIVNDKEKIKGVNKFDPATRFYYKELGGLNCQAIVCYPLWMALLKPNA
jgi:hypothetical protein